MSDLVAFLRARLDEDEAMAKAVTPLGYTTDMGGARLDEEFSHTRIRFASEDGRARIESDAAAGRHFARHNPARVLREVEAKRAILAHHVKAQSWSWPPGDGDEQTQEALGETVRHLAAVYSDHPDYRQEWVP